MGQVVQLIGNPSAGRHKSLRLGELVRALESEGATVHYAECGKSPPPIRADATHVCVAAGDGTVRHVAGAVMRCGHPVALSIYPAGTINLLAREAGYPREARDFARLILASAPRRRHYPVTIGDGYFFACAGVGPDSLAVARVSPKLKRAIGRLAYGAAFLGVLLRWPRQSIELTCDGRTIACEAFYAAKGRYYAGPWSFAPSARLDEPLLHVVALRQARRRDYARFVWTVLRGRDPASLANVMVLTCTNLRATAGGALPIQADGDIVGELPATMMVGEAPLVFC
jgi:diacylglycerol kinase family enzyme